MQIYTCTASPSLTRKLTLFETSHEQSAKIAPFSFTIREDILDTKRGVVSAKFDDTLNKTGKNICTGSAASFYENSAAARDASLLNSWRFFVGWGVLDIYTNPDYDDKKQAFAAGFAEGYLTAHHIHTTVLNLDDATFSHKSARARGN